MLRLARPEHGPRPFGVWRAVVEGGADGAFFVPEMRLHDRGETEGQLIRQIPVS